MTATTDTIPPVHLPASRSASSALPLDLNLTLMSRRPARLAAETLRYAEEAGVPVSQTEGICDAPAASVVVVTHGNLPFTKLCAASLIHDSADMPFELIIVDNASPDGTPDYLRQIAAYNANVRLVLNATNRGFAAANNQGLSMARGEMLVLLNNDTIVTPGWLSRLAGHLHDRSIGLLGSVTNRIGNEAEIETSYVTYGEMVDLAAARAREHAGKVFDLPRPAMFCVAMMRVTFERLGPLDEQFEIGMFEDDDYAMRAKAAGLKCAGAEDVFVHHFGEASFGGLFANGTRQALFHRNRERFERKWRTPWKPMGRRHSRARDALNARIAAVTRDVLPLHSSIAVVSKGDDELLDMLRQEGLMAAHFPATADGSWPGHHPADTDAAVAELHRARVSGADYLLVPHVSAWWLKHYAGFSSFLAKSGAPVLAVDGVCTLFRIPGERQA